MCGQDVWKYVEQLTNQVLAHGKVNWPLNGMPTRPKHPAGGQESAWSVKAKSRRSLAHIYIYSDRSRSIIKTCAKPRYELL